MPVSLPGINQTQAGLTSVAGMCIHLVTKEDSNQVNTYLFGLIRVQEENHQ